jgi:hypothetical protein
LRFVGVIPDSYICVDCGVDTWPGHTTTAEVEQSMRAAKAAGKEWRGAKLTFTLETEVYYVHPHVWKASVHFPEEFDSAGEFYRDPAGRIIYGTLNERCPLTDAGDAAYWAAEERLRAMGIIVAIDHETTRLTNKAHEMCRAGTLLAVVYEALS